MDDARSSGADILKEVSERVQRSEDRVIVAVAQVIKDVDEIRARVDATHSAMAISHRTENAMTARSSALQRQVKDMEKEVATIQEALDQIKPWTLQELQSRDQDTRQLAGHTLGEINSLHGEINSLRSTMEQDIDAVNCCHGTFTQAVDSQFDALRSELLQARSVQRAAAEIDSESFDKLATRLSLALKADFEKLELDSNATLEKLQTSISSAAEVDREKFKAEIVALVEDITADFSARTDDMSADIMRTQESLEAIEMSVGSWISEGAGFQADMIQRMAAFESRTNRFSKKIADALVECAAVDHDVQLHNATELMPSKTPNTSLKEGVLVPLSDAQPVDIGMRVLRCIDADNAVNKENCGDENSAAVIEKRSGS